MGRLTKQTGGFSTEELDICVDVLTTVGGNLGLLRLPPFKALRTALHPLVEARLEAYGGKNALLRKRARQQRRDEAVRVADISGNGAGSDGSSSDGGGDDGVLINQTLLRAQRLKMLEDLNRPDATQRPRLMLADGEAEVVAEATPALSGGDGGDRCCNGGNRSTSAALALAVADASSLAGVEAGVVPRVPDGVAVLTAEEERGAREAAPTVVQAPIK